MPPRAAEPLRGGTCLDGYLDDVAYTMKWQPRTAAGFNLKTMMGAM